MVCGRGICGDFLMATDTGSRVRAAEGRGAEAAVARGRADRDAVAVGIARLDDDAEVLPAG